MAEIHAETVRFQPQTALPPPRATTGPVGWMRQNLFSSPTNTLLTLASLYLLWLMIPPVIRWAFIDAQFTGTTREACADATGACWTFINARIGQILYGFYPPEYRWRIDLSLVILLIALAPLFIRRFDPKFLYAIGLVVIYPIVAFYLFSGGIFGLTHVPTHLWGGLFLTLVIAGVGIASSLPIGILLALGRRSEMPIVRSLCVAFIELIRGVPLITILFMASVMLPLFLPPGMNFDKLLRALIGVSLFASAYMAEVVRGGLQAMPKGQYEAAAALGLGYWKTMGLIILPQALRLVIPGIVNTFIALFKDTTLVIIIGLFDFLNVIQAATTDPNWIGLSLEGYAFAAVVYWIFCFGMSRYSMHIEHRLSAGRNR